MARRSYGRLIAFLSARTRDVAAAEDALSDAFASALADWPERGVPDNPEAWLLTVARRRQLDVERRLGTHDVASREIAILAEGIEQRAGAPDIPDRRLALMFACAHPAIDAGVRAPLMLQVVVGLDASAIAAAFLTSPAAMAKRLTRAKMRIREAGIPFRVPEREELAGRLDSVLEAVYASFGEGWLDPAGADVARRDLAAEALFLARVLVELLPDEPEAMGLLALMLHAEARRMARRGPRDEFVPLDRQDVAAWNACMIEEAESLLVRAASRRAFGRFQLEGAIQSAHVYRRRTGANNWPEIVQLYDALVAVTESPVAVINRAVAIAECNGPSAGLSALEGIAGDPRLQHYQPWWATRADLHARIGDHDAARSAYDRAIGCASDPAVRRFLQDRRQQLSREHPGPARDDDR